MSTSNAILPYTVTCETHDLAVLYCLRALREYAEPATHGGFDSAESDVTAWQSAEGQITFRFSDVKHRDVFLGEATQLLSGKWTRLALGQG